MSTSRDRRSPRLSGWRVAPDAVRGERRPPYEIPLLTWRKMQLQRKTDYQRMPSPDIHSADISDSMSRVGDMFFFLGPCKGTENSKSSGSFHSIARHSGSMSFSLAHHAATLLSA